MLSSKNKVFLKGDGFSGMEGVTHMEYGKRFQQSFQEAAESPEYWLEDVQLSFLDSILDAMDRKSITRKELAERLGKSQAYVSKALNAGSLNFTLKTMVNLASALGLKLSLNLEDIRATEAPLLEASRDTNDATAFSLPRPLVSSDERRPLQRTATQTMHSQSG